MDASKQYILMCQKAEEIQELRLPRQEWSEGDYYFDKFSGIQIAHNPDWGPGERIECETFIPRQDQLIDMLEEKNFCLDKMIKEFLNFVISLQNSFNNSNSYYKFMISSIEPLLLMFVMKTLYNKFWSGQEWVKEKQ